MKKRFVVIGVLVGTVLLAGLWRVVRAPRAVGQCTPVAREPNITPDYGGLVIPPNIAPLNFRILEEGRAYHVTIHADRGTPIEIASRTGSILIPPRKWRSLLEANRGRQIFVEIYAQAEDTGWRQFRRLANTVATQEIDGTLVYRFMKPIYNAWSEIGIYQRTLADFDASPVLHGRSFGQGCLNCHSFAGHRADTMTIGLRSGTYGSHTLLARNGVVRKIGAKWGYTTWHPSGRLAV